MILKKNSTSRWSLAAYALLIFLVSAIPGNRLPDLETSHLDKLFHWGEYLGFGLVIIFWSKSNHPRLAPWIPVLLGGMLYAAGDEWHQLYSGRTCSFWDWCFDTFGLLTALFLAKQWNNWRRIS